MLKGMYEKFAQKMICIVVHNRLKEDKNKRIINHYGNYEISLKQIGDFHKKMLQTVNKGRYSSSWDLIFPFHVGYRDGIVYANKLLKENNFTKEKLYELVKLLPNSYICVTMNPCYGEGFINGLFGGFHIDMWDTFSSEKNFFIRQWSVFLLKEYSSLVTAS